MRCRPKALLDAGQRGRGSSDASGASSTATSNPGNVRMTAARVALIDWDEFDVDVADLDLVLPAERPPVSTTTGRRRRASTRAAWDAAVCWDPGGTSPFAAERLADVRAV